MLQHENEFVQFKFDSPTLTVTIRRDTEPTDEEWVFTKETLLSFYDAAEKSGIRLRICFDLLGMCLLPARRYTDWANLFTENKDKTAKCVHATSIVTGSALVRTAVNAFFAMYSPVRPFRMVGNVHEAHEWLNTVTDSSVV